VWRAAVMPVPMPINVCVCVTHAPARVHAPDWPSPLCFDPGAHPLELLPTPFPQLIRRQRRQVREVSRQSLVERPGSGIPVIVRAARWLGQDIIDDVERREIARGQLQRLRSLVLRRRALPQDGGAAFGRT
jgi:hypothetical protein